MNHTPGKVEGVPAALGPVEAGWQAPSERREATPRPITNGVFSAGSVLPAHADGAWSGNPATGGRTSLCLDLGSPTGSNTRVPRDAAPCVRHRLMQFARRPRINLRPQPRRPRVNRCGLCGVSDPRMFDVPDEVWLQHVSEEQRRQMVCIECWHWLTDVIDGGAFQASRGGPLPLWSDAWRERLGIAPDRRCPLDAVMLSWFTVTEEECRPTFR
jgi:hypothetical protein